MVDYSYNIVWGVKKRCLYAYTQHFIKFGKAVSVEYCCKHCDMRISKIEILYIFQNKMLKYIVNGSCYSCQIDYNDVLWFLAVQKNTKKYYRI